MSDSGNSCCSRATESLNDPYEIYQFVGSDEGNESWSSPLGQGYQDSGDEGEDGRNDQPAAHDVAQAVDVLMPSPSQGDDVNGQMSEEDNAGTDIQNEISEEDNEYEPEASQHLPSFNETSSNRSARSPTPPASPRETTRGRKKITARGAWDKVDEVNGGCPAQREPFDDNLSSDDEWQPPSSQLRSHSKRQKEPFELSSADDELSGEDMTVSRQKKRKIQQQKHQKAQKKSRAKMHCPICSKDIYHLLRHLRQKHANPNPVQRINAMETSEAGYIYKRCPVRNCGKEVARLRQHLLSYHKTPKEDVAELVARADRLSKGTKSKYVPYFQTLQIINVNLM